MQINIDDRVAVLILNQINAALVKGIERGSDDGKEVSPVIKVRRELMVYPKGEVFKNSDLQHKLGLDCGQVSRGLNAMRDDGFVKMVHRGTWEVIKKAA